MKKLFRELEEMVVDAWPAPDSEERDGWLLRSSGGPSRRGNSVATITESGVIPSGEQTLDERIASVEAWYGERGQPPIFQVGPCAAPKELEQALSDRGYQKVGEAVLAAAAPALVLGRTEASFAVRIDTKVSDAWLEIAVGASRFSGTDEVFRGFLHRLGSRARFATAYDADGLPAAACLAIASEDRLGLYAMISLPAARRQGAARSLIHTLADRAHAEHVRELYLLVDVSNEGARALYAGCGFQDVYRYHYRMGKVPVVALA